MNAAVKKIHFRERTECWNSRNTLDLESIVATKFPKFCSAETTAR